MRRRTGRQEGCSSGWTATAKTVETGNSSVYHAELGATKNQGRSWDGVRCYPISSTPVQSTITCHHNGINHTAAPLHLASSHQDYDQKPAAQAFFSVQLYQAGPGGPAPPPIKYLVRIRTSRPCGVKDRALVCSWLTALRCAPHQTQTTPGSNGAISSIQPHFRQNSRFSHHQQL